MKYASVLLLALVSGRAVELDGLEAVNRNVKQLVVLMLENRSFDSILGRLSLDKINPDVNGLTGAEANALANGTEFKVNPTSNPVSSYDPDHSVAGVTEAIYGSQGPTKNLVPRMNGFATNAVRRGGLSAAQEVMAYYSAATMPTTYRLAQEFALVDNWFSSVPGPTQPNRFFLHAATALGHTDNTFPILGLKCPTIYDALEAVQKSWRVYTDGTLASTQYFSKLRLNPNVKKYADFQADAKKGTLPAFSYIDPDFSKNDNHPPHSLSNGEGFLNDIYTSLRASPQWNSTLFVVIYDEHGGFYDHVPPPESVPIPDSSKVSPASYDFDFSRLGVRVPALFISPWVPKGQVFRSSSQSSPKRYFEHSSVSATLSKIFGTSFLTKRDAWATSFHGVLNYLAAPRSDCPVVL
ncbi:hypothetical protein HDU91_005016 [Kappamyces sp. JEL0680]|nr:hypothetical protein HDU91_005016 [Kappamyces sp. JEL0680]